MEACKWESKQNTCVKSPRNDSWGHPSNNVNQGWYVLTYNQMSHIYSSWLAGGFLLYCPNRNMCGLSTSSIMTTRMFGSVFAWMCAGIAVWTTGVGQYTPTYILDLQPSTHIWNPKEWERKRDYVYTQYVFVEAKMFKLMMMVEDSNVSIAGNNRENFAKNV